MRWIVCTVLLVVLSIDGFAIAQKRPPPTRSPPPLRAPLPAPVATNPAPSPVPSPFPKPSPNPSPSPKPSPNPSPSPHPSPSPPMPPSPPSPPSPKPPSPSPSPPRPPNPFPPPPPPPQGYATPGSPVFWESDLPYPPVGYRLALVADAVYLKSLIMEAIVNGTNGVALGDGWIYERFNEQQYIFNEVNPLLVDGPFMYTALPLAVGPVHQVLYINTSMPTNISTWSCNTSWTGNMSFVSNGSYPVNQTYATKSAWTGNISLAGNASAVHHLSENATTWYGNISLPYGNGTVIVNGTWYNGTWYNETWFANGTWPYGNLTINGTIPCNNESIPIGNTTWWNGTKVITVGNSLVPYGYRLATCYEATMFSDMFDGWGANSTAPCAIQGGYATPPNATDPVSVKCVAPLPDGIDTSSCGLYVLSNTNGCEYVTGYTFYDGLDINGSSFDPQTRLAGNASGIADVCDHRKLCVAFNTSGFLKNSLPSYSELIPTTDGLSCSGTYIPTARAGCGIPGYKFYWSYDSPGQFGTASTIIPGGAKAVAAKCDLDPTCVGFSTKGRTKILIQDRSQWTQWTTNPCQGLYIRLDSAYLP